MLYKKNGRIEDFEIVVGKVLTVIEIGGKTVSNPSVADFEAQGWEQYTPPEQEPAPQPTPAERYKERVVELIRERYSIDDELAALRQRDTKPDQFAEYNAYVEDCKAQAREYAEEMTQNTNQ